MVLTIGKNLRAMGKRAKKCTKRSYGTLIYKLLIWATHKISLRKMRL